MQTTFLLLFYHVTPLSWSNSSIHHFSRIIPSLATTFLAQFQVVDIMYIPSRDCFFVLRSDMCIEFVKLQSRSNIHQDTVEHVGFHFLTTIYTKLQLWESYPEDQIVGHSGGGGGGGGGGNNNDNTLTTTTTTTTTNVNTNTNTNMRDYPLLCMFATGTTKNIDVWGIATESSRSYRLEPRSTLSVGGHSDICRDIVVIDKEPFMLLASCGMDGKVIIWDLVAMHPKGRRRGHRAGVECLAYDGVSLLLGTVNPYHQH